MNEVNNSGRYALVKYKSGNIEVLPVHKIRVKVGKDKQVAIQSDVFNRFW